MEGAEMSMFSRSFSDEFEKLIVGNEILIAPHTKRRQVSAELAINAGIPARAAGLRGQLRPAESNGYGFYPRFKFRVPLGEHGDCYDR